MEHTISSFSKEEVLKHLKHYLPQQAPLKDFIHHNTLHAFQHESFHEALTKASVLFGYKVYLNLTAYRELYKEGKIREEVLTQVISREKGDQASHWRDTVFNAATEEGMEQRIGSLRANWKTAFRMDLDSMVHPILFRILNSYLDQGISIWNFPHNEAGFLSSIREMEKHSKISFFRCSGARELLLDETITLESLLDRVVGDPALFEHYLFDQQFAHPGWSGMVAVLDERPASLLDRRLITLEEMIMLELLLEIDALDDHFGPIWAPLATRMANNLPELFSPVDKPVILEVKRIWQEAYEWSYYDEVLSAVAAIHVKETQKSPPFQALFCIDDRECSIRRYVEQLEPESQTFGTAGFFNVAFYFQPQDGKFTTKVCPAPIEPMHLIKELAEVKSKRKDMHFGKHAHGLIAGWLITHTLGFWSALKLFLTVFKPAKGAASVSAADHMHPDSELTIEFDPAHPSQDGLQIGFTITEMADRLEGLLRSIGLTEGFAPLIYAVGHGSSSVNNTHYAGYDCGACSGRPGSVNARVIAAIGNHPKVRELLNERGISIPQSTQFVGALHDTSRDEIHYYDLAELSAANRSEHHANERVFDEALALNARERSRRFMSVDTLAAPRNVHQKVKMRTISLFEPRPELNHATNALCLVGRRDFSRRIYLDRRAFLNSYDYRIDPNGKALEGILNAVAPVCGGINLEYYFSRMDNKQLGAGTKLPHNVMGLIGVANGIDGDLRTGLPSQMIEVHDPIRLMVIVEQHPQGVLDAISANPSTYEWFENKWIHLVAVDPESRDLFLFENGKFSLYTPMATTPAICANIGEEILRTHDNIPVYLLNA